MTSLGDCVSYFKKSEGFARLMDGLCEMYIRYERCFGAVRLSKPSFDEERAISVFFKRDYYNQALIRIGLADFERQVQKEFETDIKLETLLEAYFQKRVVRRVGAKPVMSAFSVYIEDELVPRFIGTDAGAWLREVSTHIRRTYRVWAETYIANPERAAATVTSVCLALNRVAERNKSQPAVSLRRFSLAAAGDKGAFDRAGSAGQLFAKALAWRFDAQAPATPEEFAALYFKAGILLDGSLSQVTARGVIGLTDGETNAVFNAYNEDREAYSLTLENLARLAGAEAYKNRAFVFENPAVFSAVSERVAGSDCTLVSLGGGLNTAAALLIDMLNSSGAAIYYSCDMDFAGLCLADRVYLRYPKQFVPWRLGKEDYAKAISESDFYLPEKQREYGLHNEELASLLSTMRKTGKTASQITLLDDLASDIIGFTNGKPAAPDS